MTEEYPVDLSYLEEYTDGDPDVMAELIEAFRETAQEGMADLKKGLEQKNLTIWKAAAHKLKGAAGYVGSAAFGELCRQAETSEESEMDQLHKLYDLIDQNYQNVCQFLEDKAV